MMTTVIARDATASDHLVYAWPFPLGPEEIEIACGEDEIVVMCPSWLVGDRLGPGRHRWRTPDPTRPVGAYFVSMAPVECSFDVTTSFVIPSTQEAASLRAQGSIIVRCVDPGLLIAQFVGLPFDNVNDGLIRSVTRSSERLIARVLTRRTVMAQTVVAVTDPGMAASIVDELVAYNPVAGAVFGVEFVRMTGLYVTTGDAAWATGQLDVSPADWGTGAVEAQGSAPRYIPMEPTKQGVAPGPSKPDPIIAGSIVSGEIGVRAVAPGAKQEDITTPGIPPVATSVASSPGLVPPPPAAITVPGRPADAPAGEAMRSTMKGHAMPVAEARSGSNPAVDVGALSPRATTPQPPVRPYQAVTEPPPPGGAPGEPPPPSAPAIAVPPPSSPGVPVPAPAAPMPPITPPVAASAALSRAKTPSTPPGGVPPSGLTPSLAAIMPRPKTTTSPQVPPPPAKPQRAEPAGGAVEAKPKHPTPSDGVPAPMFGIGVGGIGVGRVGAESGGVSSSPRTSEDDKSVKGEIVEKLDTGSRVLVPGADGRLVAATIRQEQSGYYELEIGGSGETLWVPRANVVPET